MNKYLTEVTELNKTLSKRNQELTVLNKKLLEELQISRLKISRLETENELLTRRTRRRTLASDYPFQSNSLLSTFMEIAGALEIK